MTMCASLHYRKEMGSFWCFDCGHKETEPQRHLPWLLVGHVRGGPEGCAPLSPTAWAREGLSLSTDSLEMQNAGFLSTDVWGHLDAKVCFEGEDGYLF